MIDVLAESILTQIQQRLANFFPFVWACLAGCLGLGACATALALFSPSFSGAWVLAAVFLSTATAGYTLAERRRTETGTIFWVLTLICGTVLACVAWKLLFYAQQITLISILSGKLLAGLLACGLLGAWAGTWLRLRFENIVNNPG